MLPFGAFRAVQVKKKERKNVLHIISNSGCDLLCS